MMNRRTFSTALLAGAAASLVSTRGMAANATPPKARNIVLVHGLFADGSCWSEVIARLQAEGLNATAVQNPLTTLPEAVASTERVLGRQDGPTVLVGHSFSGMIVTEAGVHPNVSALVYVAARAPDAGEDYSALAKTYPTPPATAGIVFYGDEGRLSEEAFLRDFAGDLPAAKAKVLYAVQEPFQKALLTGKTTQAAWRSKPSFYAVSTEDCTIDPDLHGEAYGRQDHRGKGQPSVNDLPSADHHEADTRGRRTPSLKHKPGRPIDGRPKAAPGSQIKLSKGRKRLP
jgi:pimeloyl-ACP methyl ester carboxylesterase